MEKTPECYGTYGTSSCDSCEFAEWCVDAGDPPSLQERGNHRSFDTYLEGFEGFEGVIPTGLTEGSDLSKLFGELVYALDGDNAELLWDFLSTMSALSKEHPRVYRVVRVRMLYPKATYQELADQLGLTRQAVDNHLKHCADLVPQLKAAMPGPKSRLSTTAGPFKIRCASGFISLYANDVVVLKAKQDGMNSVTMPALVASLNNMHWRKRDALLEEVK